MFASPGRPRRKAATINISELPNAKGSILAECANMHTSLVEIDEDLIQQLADLKRQKAKDDEPDNEKGCGSFAIEAKAQSFKQIDGVLSLPAARIRGDIDTPAGYLLHPR